MTLFLPPDVEHLRVLPPVLWDVSKKPQGTPHCPPTGIGECLTFNSLNAERRIPPLKHLILSFSE